MLSPWIKDACGNAIRVLDGSDPIDSNNHAVKVVNGIPSVRIRPATSAHPDELNWARGEANHDTKGWCDHTANLFGYVLKDDDAFVIQYADGAFNIGPEGSQMNGFPSTLGEATRYASMEAAEEKLRDLLLPDGTGARIVRVCDLDLGTPMLAASASVPESNSPSA